MKNSILMLLLIFGISVNSQTQNYTIIIIPEKPYNPYDHIKPVNYTNWGNAYDALAYKQAKHDANSLAIQNTVNKLNESVYNLNVTEEERNVVLSYFNSGINEVNRVTKNLDIGIDSNANKILSYLYECYNNGVKQINANRKKEKEGKQTIEKKTSKHYSESVYKKFSEKMINNFSKKLMIKSVELFDQNGKLLKSEPVDDNTYLYLYEGQIQYKKMNEPKTGMFLNFVSKENSIYKYSSTYSKPADIYIDEEFSNVKFINSDKSYYLYTIDN